MKRSLLLTLFIALLILPVSLCFAQFSITGLNEAEYIYKSAQDSLSNYFYNETLVRMNYNNIEVGLSFIAELPKYDQFEAVEDLHPSSVNYRWDERYLQANFSDMRIRAGSFTEFFGAGIMLRSYRDKAYDHDTRLSGLNIRMQYTPIEIKGLYGTLPNESNPSRNDIIGGLDLSTQLFGFTNLGLSMTSQQVRRFDDRYSTRLAAGTRMEVITDYFDIYSEYAESKSYRRIGGEVRGQAIYSFANSYLGPFTLSAGYKNYSRFDDRLNDLPSLNSSEEPLSERFNPGYDEEGLLGQIRYIPSFTTEIGLTYSEAWNSDFSIRQSDLFIEGRKDFETLILGVEYAQIELVDKEWQLWEKEITPALLFDFNIFSLPMHIRTEFGYHEKVRGQDSREYYNPLLQVDLFLKNLSLSIIGEFEFDEFDEIEDSRTWLGLEVTKSLFSHTDMKIFVGEEKGGKVCRSGVCYYTAPFKGLRLELTTRF